MTWYNVIDINHVLYFILCGFINVFVLMCKDSIMFFVAVLLVYP